MIEMCLEEGLSSEQVYLILLFFAVVFIIIAIQEENLNKSVEDIKNSLWTF